MIGQLLKVGYEVVAIGFIVLVILTIRKARAVKGGEDDDRQQELGMVAQGN